jgi:hypothetical protein
MKSPMSDSCDSLSSLSSITSISRYEIKEILVKLVAQPTSSSFWLLSRMLTLATPNDLTVLLPSLLDVLNSHQHHYLGASFSMLHLFDRLPNLDRSSLSIPLNPLIAAPYLTALNVPIHLNLTPFWGLIEFPNVKIQRLIGRIISCQIPDRQILAEQIFAALSKRETVLFDEFPIRNEDLRFAGLIEMLHSLFDLELSASGYFEALKLILISQKYPQAAIAAQFLFARILGPEFHPFDIVGIAEKQAEWQRLEPCFAEAVLRVFGLSAVRRLALKYLPRFIESFDERRGRPLIKEVLPYLRYFPAHVQFELHEFLVGECEKKRFDSELFEMTANAMRESAPAVSPSLGKFLEIARKSLRWAYVYAVVRPLLAPMGPPQRQTLSGMVILPEESKVTVGVQEKPIRTEEEVQTE